MGLDYDGKPSIERARDLFLSRIDRNRVDGTRPSPAPDAVPPEDTLFDDIVKVYLKGEALKAGLGEMNPAGFIPIEDGSPVIASVERLAPGDNGHVIMFGVYKEACEYLASRAGSMDEEFVANFTYVDPHKEHIEFTTKHKESSNSGSDWITAFLEMLQPIAGGILAGFVADIFISMQPRVTAPSNEPKQWGAQGVAIGIALLIEMGVLTMSTMNVFDKDGSMDPSVSSQMRMLIGDQAERRRLLEEAGFDYHQFTQNQRYNDSKAVKDYALKYIARNPQKLNYDHWVAFLSVVEQQSFVHGSMAMAPTYSQKWKDFRDKREVTEETVTTGGASQSDGLLVDAAKVSITSTLMAYLTTVAMVSDELYDKTAATFYFQIDDRILCCLLYFIGPLDTNVLKAVAAIMRMSIFKLGGSFADLFHFLIDGVQSAVLHMLASYANQIIDQLLSKLYQQLFKVPGALLGEAVIFCLGVDWLFKIMEFALDVVMGVLDQIIQSLQSLLDGLQNKTARHLEISAEKRTIGIMAELLERVAQKIDLLQDVCKKDPDADVVDFNEAAADAAVAFVSNELDSLFPVLDLPEEARRKHFRDVPSYTTSGIGIEVPGFDNAGSPLVNATETDLTNDCRENSPANKGVELAKQIAAAIGGAV